MIRETTAVAARQNLGDLLNQVQYREDAIVITKDGKPVAVMVDVALFERIRRMRDDFSKLSDVLGKAYEGVAEAKAQAEIDEAVASARKPVQRRRRTR